MRWRVRGRERAAGKIARGEIVWGHFGWSHFVRRRVLRGGRQRAGPAAIRAGAAAPQAAPCCLPQPSLCAQQRHSAAGERVGGGQTVRAREPWRDLRREREEVRCSCARRTKRQRHAGGGGAVGRLGAEKTEEGWRESVGEEPRESPLEPLEPGRRPGESARRAPPRSSAEGARTRRGGSLPPPYSCPYPCPYCTLPPPPYCCPYPCPYCTLTPSLPTVAPTRVPTVHSPSVMARLCPPPPHCCPYPCPYCTLTHSLLGSAGPIEQGHRGVAGEGGGVCSARFRRGRLWARAALGAGAAPIGERRTPSGSSAHPAEWLADAPAAPGEMDETCPVSTGEGTRRVQLVRGEGRDVSS